MPPSELYSMRPRVSPLSIFYSCAVTLFMVSDDLRINPARVVINMEDAVELYQLVREYIQRNLPNVKPDESAEQTWKQMGPRTSKSVPRGQVYLMPGYVALK